MDPASPATLLLLAVPAAASFALGWAAWQAFTCPAGPVVWLLHRVDRVVARRLWGVRESGPCPFPTGPSRPRGKDGPDAPAGTAALIVANHTSPTDPMLLWYGHARGRPSAVRPISFLMAKEMYELRGLGWFYRAMRAIPVARSGRDMAAVKNALTRLKSGELVGIFPEGGINQHPPDLRAVNPGVAFLALSGDAPVYPVFIAGSPRGASMVGSIFRPARARLIYGEPVDLSDVRGCKKTPELLGRVTERIMRRVADLGGVEYGGLQGGDEPAADAPPTPDPDRTPAAATPRA